MKIFLSATTNGLGSYRQGISNVLRALGAEFVVQEDFTADYCDVVESLMKKIAGCQAAICLIGPIYGSAPKLQPASIPPRSYTQIEYEYARESKKKVYVLLPSDKCPLDEIDESKRDSALQRVLQKAFRDRLGANHNEDSLRQTFDNQASLDAHVIKIWRELDPLVEKVDPADLPSHCARFLSDDLNSFRVVDFKSTAVLLIAFLTTLFEAETSSGNDHPNDNWEVDRFDNIQSMLQLLSEKAGKPVRPCIPELYEWSQKKLPDLRRTISELCSINFDKLPRTEAPAHVQLWKTTLIGVFEQLAFLRNYLLTAVELGADGLPTLRVYRGLATKQFAPVTLAYGPSGNAVSPGTVFLLSLAGGEALELSYRLAPAPDKPWILCALAASPIPGKLRAFALGGEAAPEEVSLSETRLLGRRGPLLTAESWKPLARQFTIEDAQNRVNDSDLWLLGEPRPGGKFFQLYWARGRGVSSGDLAFVHLLRKEFKDNAIIRQRLAERLSLWKQIAAGDQPSILNPLPTSNCSVETIDSFRPFIATLLVEGAAPLQETLNLHGSSADAQRDMAVRAALVVCQVAERMGLSLLTMHPRHILVLEAGDCLFTGFDSIVRADETLPPPEVLHTIFPDWADFAPELQEGGRRPTRRADVFAIGTLLQRLRGQHPNPLPLGETDHKKEMSMDGPWRNNPWECFVFHCLAWDPNRRFQSIAQCAAFFERCAGSQWSSKMIVPELVDLGAGLSISRFPVMNFEFEWFCGERGRTPPTEGLDHRFRGPFAPAVCVSLKDANAYCEWLTNQSPAGQNWRLPEEGEWVRAAGGSCPDPVFPWGQAAPTPAHANFQGKFGGPTVVGAHGSGCTGNGCADLAGNVWEWCSDRLPGEPSRIVKGGSFGSPEEDLTIAASKSRFFGGRFDDVGFRVICERKK